MFTISTKLNFRNKVSKIFNWLIICKLGLLIRKEPYSWFFNLSRICITTPT